MSTRTFEAERVLEGEALVLQLQGHPEGAQCYAWEMDGQVTAVLAVGPVKSGADAARAAIMESAGETPEAG